ncbi:hypothetical protein BBK82_23570 [Lentzea guizhouensis]|uniref:Uncharacterized protein n=1 Tax=Lentzea guizhouensis TaxID=1586287 RepID=A0A1B2HLJ2_9PSEU|nr:hypothetical protein BBK82_23570 [Lentzea guizhouensis]
MGGGSGFNGLHGQPDGVVVVVVVVTTGGGGAGLVTAGGGVVLFGVCWVLDVVVDELDGALLAGVVLSVLLTDVLGVVVTQLDAGVLADGSSSATPWIAIPTSTPSNAEPSTAEPPAAHSARTAVLLNCSRVEVRWSRSRHSTR